MNPFKSKKLKVILGILLVLFIGIQAVRPKLVTASATKKLNIPTEVEAVLRKDCYDCHSNESNLRWYDKVQPAYWMVANHIKDGRAALNFSEWDTLSAGDQKNSLYLSLNQAMLGTMPLKSYLLVHSGATPDSSDIAVLERYLLSLSSSKTSDSTAVNAAERQYQKWIGGASLFNFSVQPALNGIAYPTGWQSWKAVSTTDRFDNNTMRVIYGNDVAVRAIESGRINPYPNGTIFAKAAWKTITDSAGNVQAGEFWQVEFMIKDSKKWASTAGWGWARWRGTDLKPYGKNVLFTTECVNCHQPMNNNDFVFTMPLQLGNK